MTACCTRRASTHSSRRRETSRDAGTRTSNQLIVWSLADGKLVQEFKGHKSWCRTARFDESASRIVTAGLDKTARVWDVKTGKVLFTLNHTGEVAFAAFSPDGKRVLTLSGGARVWELPEEAK